MSICKAYYASAALVAIMAMPLAASAHGTQANQNNATVSEGSGLILLAQVTPEQEKELAAQMKATGPDKTTGIENVRVMGTVPLAGQFDNVEGRQLRARELDIAPGGIVAVHQHDGRPGVAYIVSGQLTEHRVGVDGPVTKYAGDTAFEMTGTTHWWENVGGTSARVIVVDIVPVE